jgi:DNA-directed RNA polymerase specialized sigma24 family protein
MTTSIAACTTNEAELSIGGLRGHELDHWLRGLLTRWGVRPDQREDLLQETYCRWLSRVERRRAVVWRAGVAAERSYLARVAYSALLDHARGQRAAKRGSGRTIALADAGPNLQRLCDPTPDAEERLLAAERRRDLLRVGAQACPSRRRRRRDLMILRLAWMDGCSSREIAQLSNGRLRTGGIESVLRRIRQRLRRRGIMPPSQRRSRLEVRRP